MTINQHIVQLLYCYDCVIMPGFGGFVSKYFPAEIQEGIYMFRPPSKRISFNARLKENDGLLAHYISRKEGVSYQESMQMIEISVRAWKRIIESGNKVTLEGIGKLYADAEGNLQFTPALEANFLTDSYGLGLFRSPAITEESIVAQTIKKQAQREGHIVENRNATVLLTNIYQKMRVAAVLLVVFSVLYIAFENSHYLSKKSSDSFSYIGFIPAQDSLSQAPVNPDEIKSQFTEVQEEEMLIGESPLEPKSGEVPLLKEKLAELPELTPSPSNQESVSLTSAINTSTTAPKTPPVAKNIKISAGIFGQAQNAQNRKAELESHNFEAVIEPAGRMHRVVIYCSPQESEAILSKIKETVVPDAFVVK